MNRISSITLPVVTPYRRWLARSAVAAMCVLMPLAASAQRSPGPHVLVPNQPEAQAELLSLGVPALKCCRCLEGKNVLDLSTGAAGNQWMVNGQPAAQVGAYPGWTTGTNGAKWVSVNSTRNGGVGATYRYTLKFRVPDCTIPQKVTLGTISVSADNTFKASLIGPNATPVPLAACTLSGGTCFTSAHPGTATTLTPGLYTLQVEVGNISGPTGMFFSGRLEGTCAGSPTKSD